LRDEKAGVSGGFKYEQKQNSKGEQVGGIVPHITPKSIANNEPPDEEVLVDRPRHYGCVSLAREACLSPKGERGLFRLWRDRAALMAVLSDTSTY